MKILYSEDLKKLDKKSVTGRGNSKEPMTPKKVDILIKMYSIRFDSMKLQSGERMQREKKLNFHIKNGINNINTAQATKKNEKEVMIRIHELKINEKSNEE